MQPPAGSGPHLWSQAQELGCLERAAMHNKNSLCTKGAVFIDVPDRTQPASLIRGKDQTKSSTMDVRATGGGVGFLFFLFLALIKLEMDKVSREYLHSQESLGQDPIIIFRAKKHIFLIREALMCALHAGSCSYMCN